MVSACPDQVITVSLPDEGIVSTINAFIKRHPVPTYFVLTFAISWGGILLVIFRTGGIPVTKEQF